ncbi:LacI family transcriptional regulator [Streptomyces pilosus]|uniref:LacI family DNA-binding transcriptional regulator n=1 Tax=Streptomyces pilosus TaxID=28893 RepID=UPI00167A7006|nr:LacI family DNA-binding transcriptional regulator [Streptomyces pilosus]GGV46106.1 LacI family transcriptional regulator [Streptomyces pilosus]
MTDRTAGRRITAADIAQAVGVSRATVGYVLNRTPGQTISEATRRRVLEEAARRGYRPHSAAQALARGRSGIVLLVLPDWPMRYVVGRYVEEASLALDEAGYTLVTYTRHVTGRGRPLWESLSPEVVVGFVPFAADELASLRAAGVSKIFPAAGSRLGPEAFSAGTRLQVEHLYDLGHRRLAFAASPDPRVAELVEERLLEARRTAARLGLTPVVVRSMDHDHDRAAAIVRTWHEEGVTAVVAHNDDTAAMVVGAALRSGLSVPGDLAVVGHDDTPLATLFTPSLSSVRVDVAALGRRMAALALHATDGQDRPPAEPVVDMTLVPRESTLGTGRCPASEGTHM